MTNLLRLLRSTTAAVRAFRRDEGGGPLVEFTLVVPLLLALTYGCIEFGFIFVTYNEMQNAARQAARELSVRGVNEAGAEALVASMLTFDHPFTIVAENAATTGTDNVRVTVSVPLSDAGILNAVPLPDTPLQVQVVMRQE